MSTLKRWNSEKVRKMAGIVCMLVEDTVVGIEAKTALAITENLPPTVEVIDSQTETMSVHLPEGDKTDTLQLGRLMRSLYQQAKGKRDGAHIYFGAVTFDGDGQDVENAMHLAKRIASDCISDGNRRISCFEYKK